MTRSPEAKPSQPTSGLALLDKPGGWTSHQVVGRVRRLAGTRKVGHAGTLDPMATGLLIIGVEKATRLLGYLALSDKAYEATIRLGIATITDDAEGEVVTAVGAAGLARSRDRGGHGRAAWRHPPGAGCGVGDQDRRCSLIPASPGWSDLWSFRLGQ